MLPSVAVVRLDAEFASGFTGSDFPYARTTGEVAAYQSLSDGVVLAARARPGWARSIEEVAGDRDLGLHPQRRFFAGGPNSVRGFAQSRLGPKILVIDGTDLVARDPSCQPHELNLGQCDPASVPDDALQPRPTGGTLLLEGNVELRFPLWGERVRGVVFMDAGQVWNHRIEPASLDDLAWAPGMGVRYFSPIGPIRVDVGYNPLGSETLAVKTTQVEYCRRDAPLPLCVAPVAGAVYDDELWELRNTNTLQDLPAVSWRPGGWFERLQLHLSIGQAF